MHGDHRAKQRCFEDLEEGSVKKLAKLSWRVRASGGTCTAEVDEPIKGFNPKNNRINPYAPRGSEGPVPTVSWISFDGDIYWVRCQLPRAGRARFE